MAKSHFASSEVSHKSSSRVLISNDGTSEILVYDFLRFKIIWVWFFILQVSGYTVVYEGLTFTTVRGAGHQVPQCQPCRAFALFKNFVMGN